MRCDVLAVGTELLLGQIVDTNAALNWWISKVKLHFASEGPKFAFDSGKSIRVDIAEAMLILYVH